MANDDDKPNDQEDRGDLILRMLRELRDKIDGMDAKVDHVSGRVDGIALDVRELGLQSTLLELRMGKAMDYLVQHDKRLAALETQ